MRLQRQRARLLRIVLSAVVLRRGPLGAHTRLRPGWRHYILSYGMGAESTLALLLVLTDPRYRPVEIAADFHNLIVVVAQTGDEWSYLGEMVEQWVLPVLRRRKVRFVEVARNGPTAADGITVLQDTREPYRVHLEGVYALSREHRDSGTMPQRSGHHTCAQKSKGAPLDAWRAATIGDAPFYHMIGYNKDETSRIAKDAGYAMGGRREPRYLVAEWDMSRADCVDRLHSMLGVRWAKSACRECPYLGQGSWAEQLPRFVQRPFEAARHLVDEWCCLSLNPRSALFGPGRSMISRLDRDGAREVVDRAMGIMAAMPWGLYRVRRRFHGQASASRSVRRIGTGTREQMRHALTRLGHALDVGISFNEPIPGAPKKNSDLDFIERLWIHRRTEKVYPTVEEFYVALPLQPVDKQAANFDTEWSTALTRLGLDAATGATAEEFARLVARESGPRPSVIRAAQTRTARVRTAHDAPTAPVATDRLPALTT